MATHEELMTSLKFDESFRNALRDYYSYGFKSLNDFEKEKVQTLKNDWERLNNILYGYLEWSEGRGKDAVMFATKDSAAMTENPFHRLYRFCKFNHNDPTFFFNTILALSKHVSVPKQDEEQLYDSLGINLLEEAKKRDYYQYIEFIKKYQEYNVCLLRIEDKKPLAKNIFYLVSEDNGVEKDKIKVAVRYIDIVKGLVEDWNNTKEELDSDTIETFLTGTFNRLIEELQIETKEASVQKYIDFIKMNANRNIRVIDKEHYSYYLVCFDNSVIQINNKDEDACTSMLVQHKDERFLKTLYKLWYWINKSTSVDFDKNKNILICKYGNQIKKIPVHSSNINELQMVNMLVEGKGNIERFEEAYLGDTMGYLEDCFELLEKIIEKKELSSSQLQCFFPGDVGLFTGNNTSINGKLKNLQALGILKATLKQDENKQENKGKDERKAAGNKWTLAGCSLQEIIQRGEAIESGNGHEFQIAFQTAIDFYSKYCVLGTCGTFIKDRMDRLGTQNKSPFRFRHDYFMQALNDFNLIDLLYVIEDKKWCEIQYKHGTANFSTTLLCKPLEIRISATTGREFLVFYNPIKRSCTNLRLEFIEEVIAYEEEDVLKALKGVHISRKMIASDIVNARNSLKYMWGVSFSMEQEENVISPVKLRDVKLNISYDPKTEYYIKNRILKESRSASEQIGVKIQPEKKIITVGARISDPKEMRPWVRSLYSRVQSAEGIETDDFSLLDDIEKCIAGIEGLLKMEETTPPKRWINNEATLDRINEGKKVRKHEELFNEIFGVYYYIISEVILLLCSKDTGRVVPKEQIVEVVNKVRKWYMNQGGNRTSKLSFEEVNWLLENDAFGVSFEREGKKRTAFKYECSSDIEFYRDILPLTTLEVRWLKMIIIDSRMKCFLSDEQIEVVKSFIDETYPNVDPLPQNAIVYFDRHIVNASEKAAERLHIMTFTKAISKKLLVDLSFTTRIGNKINEKFKPIVIEFSKRNNKFQVQLQSCVNNKFYTVNLPQINYVVVDNEEFDYYQALEEYQEYRNNRERSVQIQFYDVKNMADRILTEFSPWKKYCVYDRETHIYTLEIFYQKDEELDLVIRLMGYGPSIHFVEKEHSIAREILRRYTKQRDIILKRQKSIERGE